MKAWIVPALVTGMFVAVAAPRADAEVRLVIADGYVSIDAKDATVRQILDEWARVGRTRIVNGERITGAPVTLQLTKVPEAEALDILLRSVSGYLAATRPTAVPNTSRFDRILVMPTSVAPRVSAAAAPQQPPAFQPPPMPTDDLQIEDPAFVMPAAGPNGQRGPGFPPQFPNGGGQFQSNPRQNVPTTFPPNPQAPPPVQSGPASIGAPEVMPVGVSTPGMVVAPPQQPGQPVTPADTQR